MSDVWRAPDGTHWRVYTSGSATTLLQVEQDPDTRQWHGIDGAGYRTLTEDVFEATYTPVEREPLRDLRITRLSELTEALLTDYEYATGAPAASAVEIRAVLAEVAAIPEQERRRRHEASRSAARRAFDRGRRG